MATSTAPSSDTSLATDRTAAVAAQAASRVTPGYAGWLIARAVLGADPVRVAVTSPMTAAVLVDLPHSGMPEVDRAFADARAAQPSWAAVPIPQREAILLRLHDLVLAHQDELMDLVQLESGKARAHAFEEVADVALAARHYGRNTAAYLRAGRYPGVLPLISRADVVYHPKGVVGVVSPWNYPLSLSITDAMAAIAAGNAVVLRPDSLTSLTALRAVRLFDEAGLPPGVLEVVLGRGSTVGQGVIDRADYVCFTGSTPTGRAVAETAGRRLVGCSLELGGKNPMIIRADADLRRAVPGAVRGVYASGGQLCMSIERLIVDRAIAAEFTQRFAAAVRAMRLGPELSFGYDMGSLLDAGQLATVSDHVEDARAKGATVLAGGRARPDIGPFFYEPTVLTDVTPQMRCFAEETFGPVVSIYQVDGDAEALAFANDTAYGLNASIFTRDLVAGRAVAARLKAGTVNVNEGYAAGWAAMGAPMGGMKDSGLGRRHGAEGIRKYTEAQTIATQRLTDLGAPPGVTDRAWARLLTVGLRGLKAVGRR